MTDQAHQLAAAIVDTIGEATSGHPMSRTLPGFAARLSENLAAKLRPILFPEMATGPGSEGPLFERCVQAGCSHAAYQHYDEDQPDNTRCYVSGCLCRRYRSGPHLPEPVPARPEAPTALSSAVAMVLHAWVDWTDDLDLEAIPLEMCQAMDALQAAAADRMTRGYFNVDRQAYDGRPLTPPLESRRLPRRLEGHGPGCSANPEVGCVCGLEDYMSDHDGSAEGW